MFRRLHDIRAPVSLRVNGESVIAEAGEMVGAVLLAMGTTRLRTTARSGSPRGLYCGMGVCFECLVTINGVANRQACLTPVEERMEIITGGGAPEVSSP